VGSITVDENLMDTVGLIENEQVHVLNITNGERLTTYVIPGPRNSGIIGINGAAAHKAKVNDLVIICAYVQLNEAEIKTHRPKVILVDTNNKINQNLSLVNIDFNYELVVN
jgi:aspartate 1-decarboxylase